MVKINCTTKDSIKITEVIAFQGSLKKRTDADLNELKESLLNEGLMMPFAVWKHEGKNYLLDGHGRKEVLMRMAGEEPELLSVDWPCVYIEADTEADARKALLQITSSYGKITKQGYKQFCVSIPDYKAPSISKFVSKPTSNVKVKAKSDKTVMKIRVSNDRIEQVREIFKQFDFIEVL